MCRLSHHLIAVVLTTATGVWAAIAITPADLPFNVSSPFALELRVDSDRPYTVGNRLIITVRSERDCFLTLFNIGSSGTITILSPNRHAPDGVRLQAGVQRVIPSVEDPFSYEIGPPEGIETLVAVASQARLDLAPDDLASYVTSRSHFRSVQAENAPSLFAQARDVLLASGDESWASQMVRFQVGEPATVAEPTMWALIAGVARYPDTLSDLYYSDSDARLFDKIARDKLGVPASQCRLLRNEEATVGALREGISWLARNAKSADSVYFFFSGHGGSRPDDDGDEADGMDEYICAYDGDLLDDDFARLSSAIEAQQFVIFVDSCFAGGATRGVRMSSGSRGLPTAQLSDGFADAERVTFRDLERPGTCTFAACRPDQLSQECPNLQQGVFTHFLAKGLAGLADADGDGRVSLREAYDFTLSAVSHYTRGEQHPHLLYNIAGDYILR